MGDGWLGETLDHLRTVQTKMLAIVAKLPTVRDLLAAHAPAEPQEWFTPVAPDAPVEPPMPEGLHPDSAVALCSWQRGSSSRRLVGVRGVAPRDHEALDAYDTHYTAWKKAVVEWQRAYARARRVQWPYACLGRRGDHGEGGEAWLT